MHEMDHAMTDEKDDAHESSKDIEPSAKKQLEGNLGKIDELVLMMLALKDMMPQIAPSPAMPSPMPGQPSLPPPGMGAGQPPMGSSMPPMGGGGGMQPAMQLQQAMQGARGLM